MMGDAIRTNISNSSGSFVQGPAANDVAEAGNPVQIGVSVDETTPTAATEGDVRRLRGSAEGELCVQPSFEGTNISNASGVFAQGPAASDAAEAGNPVQMGASVDDTAPAAAGEGDVRRIRTTTTGELIVTIQEPNTTRRPLVGPADSDGVSTASTTALYTRGHPFTYNETTWDRHRGNTNIVVLASELDTQATRTSADLTNYNARGILLHLRTQNLTGTTATYTPQIEAKMNDGSYVDLWLATAAVTTATDVLYEIYPGASGGNITEVDGLALPRTFRVVLTVASADVSNNLDTLMDASLIL